MKKMKSNFKFAILMAIISTIFGACLDDENQPPTPPNPNQNQNIIFADFVLNDGDTIITLSIDDYKTIQIPKVMVYDWETPNLKYCSVLGVEPSAYNKITANIAVGLDSIDFSEKTADLVAAQHFSDEIFDMNFEFHLGTDIWTSDNAESVNFIDSIQYVGVVQTDVDTWEESRSIRKTQTKHESLYLRQYVLIGELSSRFFLQSNPNIVKENVTIAYKMTVFLPKN